MLSSFLLLASAVITLLQMHIIFKIICIIPIKVC